MNVSPEMEKRFRHFPFQSRFWGSPCCCTLYTSQTWQPSQTVTEPCSATLESNYHRLSHLLAGHRPTSSLNEGCRNGRQISSEPDLMLHKPRTCTDMNGEGHVLKLCFPSFLSDGPTFPLWFWTRTQRREDVI